MTSTSSAPPAAGAAARVGGDGGRGFEPVTGGETVHLHAETAAGALAGLLRRRGYRAHLELARYGSASTTSALLVTGADAAGTARMAAIDAFHETQWTDVAYDRPARRATLRRPLLDQSLTLFGTPLGEPRPLVDYLTTRAWPDAFAQPLAEAAQAAALALWWDDRMAEGHTPGPHGSAHLLLGLLLPTDLMRRLAYAFTYDPDVAPHLRSERG